MFKSTDQALRRMFELLNSDIVRTSSINRMRGSSGGSDLSIQDWHAQAAMMMAGLERELSPVELAAIYAYYGRELRGGKKERVCADLLVQSVSPSLPSGMHSRRGVEKLVRIYFGADIGMVSVRCDLKTSERTAYEYRKRIADSLMKTSNDADNKAREVFIRQGILARDFDFCTDEKKSLALHPQNG
jgi:hypothetical protein